MAIKTLNILACASIFMAANAGITNADTLTFDGYGEPSDIYSEGEFTVSAFGEVADDGAGHIDLGPSQFGDAHNITFGDGLFSAFALDINVLQGFYTFLSDSGDPEQPDIQAPFEIVMRGLRDGVETASMALSADSAAGHYDLDGFFTIDQLIIMGVAPETPAGYMVEFLQDVHFEYDNLEVARVPLPLSLPLLAFGVGALGMLRFRRRQS